MARRDSELTTAGLEDESADRAYGRRGGLGDGGAEGVEGAVGEDGGVNEVRGRRRRIPSSSSDPSHDDDSEEEIARSPSSSSSTQEEATASGALPASSSSAQKDTTEPHLTSPTPPPPTHQAHSNDERDATELEDVSARPASSHPSLHRYYSAESRIPVVGSSWAERNVTGPVRKFWGRQVRVAVPVKWSRDHLAHERTYLAYTRTSLALSIVGITTAQLFRLQHVAAPDDTFGYYELGIPVAASFITASIVVCLLGAFRFWRQQNALVRGKCISGGWEVLGVMGVSFAMLLGLGVVTVGADIRREV